MKHPLTDEEKAAKRAEIKKIRAEGLVEQSEFLEHRRRRAALEKLRAAAIERLTAEVESGYGEGGEVDLDRELKSLEFQEDALIPSRSDPSVVALCAITGEKHAMGALFVALTMANPKGATVREVAHFAGASEYRVAQLITRGLDNDDVIDLGVGCYVWRDAPNAPKQKLSAIKGGRG